LTQCQRVTDRQTDRQTDGFTIANTVLSIGSMGLSSFKFVQWAPKDAMGISLVDLPAAVAERFRFQSR